MWISLLHMVPTDHYPLLTLGAHARGLLQLSCVCVSVCVCVCVCVCVYLSVPAVDASASVETSKQRYSRVSLRLFLDFDRWIFEKTFLSKVMG